VQRPRAIAPTQLGPTVCAPQPIGATFGDRSGILEAHFNRVSTKF